MTPYYINAPHRGCWIDLDAVQGIESISIWDEELWTQGLAESVASFELLIAFQEKPKVVCYYQSFDMPPSLVVIQRRIKNGDVIRPDEEASIIAVVAEYRENIRRGIEKLRTAHAELIEAWKSTSTKTAD